MVSQEQRGQSLLMLGMQQCLLEPGVPERVAAAAFHAPQAAKLLITPHVIEEDVLRVKWLAHEDHIRIDWRKTGHADHFTKGFRREGGFLTRANQIDEGEFGECVVSSKASSGFHEDFIKHDIMFFYFFFILYERKMPVLFRLFVGDPPPERLAPISFSARLPSHSDTIRDLQQLITLAGLEKTLQQKQRALEAPGVVRRLKATDAIERAREFDHVAAKILAQKEVEREKIERESLSTVGRKQKRNALEQRHAALIRELNRLYFP